MTMVRLGSAALFAVVVCVLCTTTAQEPVSSSILQQQAAGTAGWAGNQVQFLFVKTDSPTSSARAGGSSIVYVPPVSFPTENGEPVLTIRDPERFCDGVWVTVGGDPRYVRTPKELAKLVRENLLDPKTPVDVSFELTLHDDLSLKVAIWEACHAQLRKIEDRTAAQPATPATPATPAAPAAARPAPLTAEELKQSVQSIYMVPARELRLRCESPGLETSTILLGNNSNLSRNLAVEGRVTAGFVSRLYSKAGITMRLEFLFDAYGERITTVSARDMVSAMAKTLLKGRGDGGADHQSRADGGSVRVFTTRDTVNWVSQTMKTSREVVVAGASPEDINLLLTMLQQNDADIMAVSTAEIELFFKEQFDIQKALAAPSVVKAFERLGDKKELTEEDYERFASEFASHGRKSQGGGGFSLGPISLGGGGGSETQDTTANKKQQRDAMRKFVQDMYEYKTKGDFKVAPKLDYRVCSSQTIDKLHEQILKMKWANKVTSRTLSSRFGTARETLRSTTDTDILIDIRRRQELLNQKFADLNKELAPKPPEPKK